MRNTGNQHWLEVSGVVSSGREQSQKEFMALVRNSGAYNRCCMDATKGAAAAGLSAFLGGREEMRDAISFRTPSSTR